MYIVYIYLRNICMLYIHLYIIYIIYCIDFFIRILNIFFYIQENYIHMYCNTYKHKL